MLRCGDCASFSAAAFQDSAAASCVVPPLCRNTSACELSLLFLSPSESVSVPVAAISIDPSVDIVPASQFSVNGCTEQCSALLSPFDSMLLLRFEVAARSENTWVDAVPADADALEKPPPLPADDVAPIRRGRASPGSSVVSSLRRSSSCFNFWFRANAFCRSHFS